MDLLKFDKRIDTPKYSVFYSFARFGGKLLGFCRRSIFPDWRVREISCMEFEDNFINPKETEVMIGEDPRTFTHQGKTYVIDNYLNDMHIYCLDDLTRVKLQVPGKNLTFLSVGQRVFVIWSFMPFTMVELDIETGQVVRHLEVENGFPMRYLLYRGGTPGYHLKDDYWFGFGHMTYQGQKHPAIPEDVLYHDPFLWIVKMEPVPKLQLFVVHKPPDALNLFDPTCIIDDHLVSAECATAWGPDTDYVTNLYKLDIERIRALADA